MQKHGNKLYRWVFGRGQELPLQADGTALALAALLGVMVYLAALGFAASVVLHSFGERWQNTHSGEFTVEVRPLNADEAVSSGAESLTARVTKVLQTLRATPSITSATPLAETEMRRLLQPWLGEDINFQDLPLPVLITVQINPAAAATIPQLAARLQQTVPGVRVDDHGAWLADLRQFVTLLRLVALSVMALLAVAAVLTVVLVTRVSLLAHRDVVDILHIMGATDTHIAWQFQTFIARIALVGSAAGAVLAFFTLLLAEAFGSSLNLPLLPAVGLGGWHFLLVLLLPIPAILLATLVARGSVLWWVRQLP